jgi:hypothetical protein
MVIYSGTDVAVKVDMGINAENHYGGDPTHCPGRNHTGYAPGHRAGPLAVAVLHPVLADGVEFIRKCSSHMGSAQGNESFDSINARYCDKRQNFCMSSPARFAMAVIAHAYLPGRQDDLREAPEIDPVPSMSHGGRGVRTV